MRKLYDEVHAILVEELLQHIKKEELPEAKPVAEVPYDYYGHKGRVDISIYHPPNTGLGNEHSLSIYEVWTRIKNLNEAIGKYNEKMTYFPKFFTQEYEIKEVSWLNGNFVLLNSFENIALVREYLSIFDSVFNWSQKKSPRSKILQSDGCYLFDPLGENEKLVAVFQDWEADLAVRQKDSLDKLLEEGWSFLDSKHFLEEYRKKKAI